MPEANCKTTKLRVLIVGRYVPGPTGEWAIPVNYFRELRARGIDTRLVVLDETRADIRLKQMFPEDIDRLYIIGRSRPPRLIRWMQSRLPVPLLAFPVWKIVDLHTQWRQRKVVQALVKEHAIDVVHQATPVGPNQPSLIYDVSAPVVIGPLTGTLGPPAGFCKVTSLRTRLTYQLDCCWLVLCNWLFPGKRLATILFLANEHARGMLPKNTKGEIIVLNTHEIGIDTKTWKPVNRDSFDSRRRTRFTFVGRLVPTKAVDLLLEAMAVVRSESTAELRIIGTGPMLKNLRAMTERLGLDDSVEFINWLPQSELTDHLAETDVLVHPSIDEPGGQIILESMAMGIPVIATRLYGPAISLDDTCGILIKPENRDQYVKDLAAAMIRLATSDELRQKLGTAGRARAVETFDWSRKVEDLFPIYERASELWSGTKSAGAVN